MPAQAPRIDPRLVAALPHLDDERQPIAETNRRVGTLALAIGVPRPSYQQIRCGSRKLERTSSDAGKHVATQSSSSRGAVPPPPARSAVRTARPLTARTERRTLAK